MKLSKTHRFLRRSWNKRFIVNYLSAFVFLLMVLIGCAGQMSVEEAKQVTVTMSGEAFVPPPRRIDDILSILDQPSQFDPDITKTYRVIADQSPPANASDRDLAFFYINRAGAATKIFHFHQALQDSRTAFQYAEKAKLKADATYLRRLGRSELWAGNFTRAIGLMERSLKIKEINSTYASLVMIYSRTGDLESAERTKSNGIYFCRQQKGVYAEVTIASMNADILEARGKFKEAEKHRRRTRRLASTMKSQEPSWYLGLASRLALNLEKQNKLIEAELEWRSILKETIGLAGRKSVIAGVVLGHMGGSIQKQGRLAEAEKLIAAGLDIMDQSGLSADSYLMGRARMWHGNVLTDQHKFIAAMQAFDLARAGLLNNHYLYEKIFARNPNLILSLIKTNRVNEAFKLTSAAHTIYQNNYGNQNYVTAEIQSLRGLAYMKMNKLKPAIEDFLEATPILLTQNMSGENDFSTRLRLKIILETHIDLLSRIERSPLEQKLNLNAKAEAFRLADAIRGQVVQSALGASGARAAIKDPQLKDLMRKEQDAQHQISALQAILIDTLAAPENQRSSVDIKSITSKLEALSNAQSALLDEIKTRFPKYADFTNPQTITPDIAQNHLQPDEALISIYTANDQSYVWALPHKGRVAFAAVPLGKDVLNRTIAGLRNALAPDPETLGDIPAFDLQKAHELYNRLLKPVEAGWKGARHLIIVAHGPLGQLPFAILPTAAVKLHEGDVLFANYRKVPWLIRKVSITRQPSVSSFITLRSLPQGSPERKAFAGFGDPFFNRQQLTQAETEKRPPKTQLARLQKPLQVRGIRITDTGNLDSDTITSSHLGMLNRLPDTSDEILSIAEALSADSENDVFVGKRASEHLVKTMDLSDRRVIAFATHALVPGDLDGLDQPALALCAPEVTGENEDGLLTLGEILKLKLKADWVVLSACNTGAADGAGSEAVSGLGRAFFYAGSRAILVSMWPVETTSARQLTSQLFEYQKEDKTLSRASALRQSILALIDGPGMKDPVSGKIAASYAHPFFWAPFIIVGESSN
ncbi:MAG: CHAT domain-containing protein [Desulfobacterales bacterium]|jgi:CHAT domain-containing protein/tetratricopeptide (TPR) repeat protein